MTLQWHSQSHLGGNQVTKEKGKSRQCPNENEECYNSSEKLRVKERSIGYGMVQGKLYYNCDKYIYMNFQ